MKFDCDIVISGGGIAGLAAAAAFGSAGFDVICVDPAPPVTDVAHDGADMRSTALLQPARDLLLRADVWPALESHAAPLQVMRIVDAGGEDPKPRLVRDFDAADVSELPFGWNFPNWLLKRVLSERLSSLDTVDFRPGVATTSLFTRTASARVGLSDGTHVTTRLVIAADGRDSPMRQSAGIGVRTRRYGQKALAFAVTHPLPHDDVSTEIHRHGGPFTLVPLPDRNGMPSSAVVWMDDGAKTLERADMDLAAFDALATQRSASVLGPLSCVTPRQVWPIISQQADRLSAERLALMAEAAHVLPPIGAQGLNMSMGDITCLLDLAEARPDALGDAQMMGAYHDARHRDIALRMRGIDLLNRASQAHSPAARDLRAVGLNALYAAAPVRRLLMQMGLGVR